MDIELADAVAAVREELLDAATRGTREELAFVVGPIEMEFMLELRADAQAKAGFKAWVLSADTQIGVARARTHRVKVTLTPKRPDGGDLQISAATREWPDADGAAGHLGR
ncbi:trypco2 family protein [Sphaerisporangium sp. NPDC005288]|uniref:trypco2 family protein n=1 Tax=Sphaerisporangium sp. NPDC005288 TaxID=3155114 RepID=UPI0033A297AF